MLYKRYLIHNFVQQPQETIDQFVFKLGQLAEPYKFGSLEDKMIRDGLVLGCQVNQDRAILYREKECFKKSL